jgi:stage II sporulation protein E
MPNAKWIFNRQDEKYERPKFVGCIEKGLHPTQKNVKLMEWLIKIHTNEGNLVLDPFAGSGTTLVASKNLNRKCIRPNELIKQANNIYELFRLNNKWKKKLVNSRAIVGEQLIGISEVVKSMMDEVAVSVEFRNDIEEEISVALDRKGLDFDDILAVKNNRNKYEITIYKKPCTGQNACSREYSTIVSKALGVKMMRECSGCKINEDNSLCQFRLVETEKFSTATAVAKLAKEEISGDNYSFGNIRSGGYMVALSDGMGSGIRAAIESNTTVSLLEKFMEAGYDRSTAIKAINSVLVFRSCDENYATIDLNIIDLYNGIAEFVKIGSAPSYIKSGESISVINSVNLPVGILDDINIESDIINIKNGDMIVMVSDGVTEADKELKEKWIIRALREYNSGNPKDVAEYILNKAKQSCGNKILDDMTVIVTKIWKIQ